MTKPNRATKLLEQENVALHAQLKQARMALAKLYRFSLECGFPRGVKLVYPATKEDAEAPFFSEAYLYPLFGKEDARTVLAFLSGLRRVLSVDRPDVYLKADRALHSFRTATFSDFKEQRDVGQLFGWIRELRDAERGVRDAESSSHHRLLEEFE